MGGLAHWDDVETYRREVGHIAGTWRDLGSAAGSVGVGVKRIEVDPGKWSTAAHVECGEEEIFFVLRGSGISWQYDGEDEIACRVGAGDCLVHRAGHEAHTLHAGPEGLDVIAFGERALTGSTFLPRAGVSWLGPTWIVSGGEDDRPWTREAAVGEPPVGDVTERPDTIVNVADVEGDERAGRTVARRRRNLGRAAGSQRTGLQHVTVPPGRLGVAPHCHSAEEEIFVVLDGDGVLLLGGEELPLEPGTIVARPPATGVAHALRGGEGGLTYLAYGTRVPNDITYYPRSNKIFWRGVGVIGRIEKLDYWDGED